MKRALFTWFTLCICISGAHASQWELRTVLPSQNISTLVQDSLGFIWYGGANGLMRFDGYSSLHFPASSHDSYNGYINRIYSTSSDELIICASDGLYAYHPSTNVFRNLSDTLSSVNVTSLLPLSNGQYIVTTFKGIYRFDAQFHLLSTLHVRSEYVYCVIEDNKGNLLVGSDAGLEQLVPNDSTYRAHLLSRGRVKFIYKDTNDRLWMNLTGRIVYCNYSQLLRQGSAAWRTITHNLDVVSATYMDDQLWIATRGQGVVRILNTPQPQLLSPILFDEEKSELKNTVFSIMRDHNQNIWIGTIDGLYIYTHYPQHGFNILSEGAKGLSNNIVSDIHATSSNDAWLGTASGINHLQFIQGEPVITRYYNQQDSDDFIKQNRIQMIEDAGNGLFLTSTKHYLLFFNPKTGKFNHDIHIDSICNAYGMRFVRAYHRDQDGNIWMAFKEGGIGVWLSQSQQFRHIDWQGYQQDLHRSIYRDRSGQVWVSSDADGLWCLTIDSTLSSTTQSRLYPRSMFDNHNITYFTIANDGSIWCGTPGGVYKDFKHLPLHSVEGQTYIAALQEDNNGHIWIVGSQGIYQVDIATGSNRYFELTHNCDLTKIGYIVGVSKSSEGTLYIGGVNGLVYFHPDSIHAHYSESVPVITRVIVSQDVLGRDVNYLTAPFVLSPYDNQITFEFSTLRYADRSNISYAYQLSGVDKDWVYTDATRRYASYTNLKPGRYTFKVRSTNNQGEELDNIRTVRFRICAPWYLTWWGILIILSGVAGIIYLLFSVVTLRTELKRLYFSLRSPVSLLFRRKHKDEAMEKAHPYIEPIEIEQAPKDIMLINFDVELATALKTHLHEKYRVRDFQYDAEAVDYIRHQQPAVIVIAQQEDGDDAAHTCHDIIQLRKNDHSLLVPNIMIVSAIDTPECEQAAYLAGADVWINSMASVEVIKSRIQQLVKQKQRLTEQIRQNLIVNPKQVNVLADTDIFMTNLMQMIEDNMSNDAFSVEQVAEQLHISTSSLYRKIKENTQMSPNEYIRWVRLNRAAQLLESQKYKVFEICYMVGFSDQRYFATCFKRQFGVTPKAYQGGKND